MKNPALLESERLAEEPPIFDVQMRYSPVELELVALVPQLQYRNTTV